MRGRAGPVYVAALAAYLEEHAAELCDEHRERFRANPLRVLDCKRPECRAVTEDAPRITDYLDEACAAHLARVRAGPRRARRRATGSSPRLVRGLDYYTRTTFEFAATSLDLGPERRGRGRPLRRSGRGHRRARRARASASASASSGCCWPVTPKGVFAVDPPPPDAFVVDVTGGTAARDLVRRAAPGRARRRCAPTMAVRSSPSSSRRTAPGPGTPLIVGPEELAGGRRDGEAAARTSGPQETVPRAHGGASGCGHALDDGDEGRPVTATTRDADPSVRRARGPSTSGHGCALCGWVARRREHGEHLAFLDLRDHSGIVQCVVDGSVDVRSEWVVRVEGTVRRAARGHGQRRAAHR